MSRESVYHQPLLTESEQRNLATSINIFSNKDRAVLTLDDVMPLEDMLGGINNENMVRSLAYLREHTSSRFDQYYYRLGSYIRARSEKNLPHVSIDVCTQMMRDLIFPPKVTRIPADKQNEILTQIDVLFATKDEEHRMLPKEIKKHLGHFSATTRDIYERFIYDDHGNFVPFIHSAGKRYGLADDQIVFMIFGAADFDRLLQVNEESKFFSLE